MVVVMTALVVAAFVSSIAGSTPGQAAPPQDWSRSPEAYFLTAEEKREWSGLSSDAAREAFQESYWKRRDPTPLTARNEFRETIEARIRSADAQLTVGKTPGSRTARGMVLILLGRPSSQQLTLGPVKGRAPEMITPGILTLPNDAFSTSEFHTWIYERETSADLLDALGMPRLEISFIIEPGHRDQMQQPDRFQQWREILARRSIE
jgi:GWxTD domain-containing protein